MIETMHCTNAHAPETAIAVIGAHVSANARDGRNSEHDGHATAGGAYTLASGQRLNGTADDKTAAILAHRRRAVFWIWT
ncbi:hypothetical protein C266_11071 [Pandoraea sp. SD6-2]|nr:hypothetical protein C266_11071 [Pandoraea sp. SD6-2]